MAKKPMSCCLCSKPVPKGVRWCPPIGGEPGCWVLHCLDELMDEGKERPGARNTEGVAGSREVELPSSSGSEKE